MNLILTIEKNTYTTEILREGYYEKYNCGEAGKHATSSISCQIRPTLSDGTSLANLILKTDGYISAVIKDGDTTIFSGVIRPFIETSSSVAFEENLELEIMDYTETMHLYVWDSSTDGPKQRRIYPEVKKNTTLSAVLEYLFGLGNKTINKSTCPDIAILYFKLNSGDYIDDVIATLLQEYELDYKWSALGVAEFFYTFPDDTDSEGTINTAIEQISTTRSDDTSDGLKLNWRTYKIERGKTLLKYYSGNIQFSDFPWTAAATLEGKFWSGKMHDKEFNTNAQMPSGNLWNWNLSQTGIRVNGERALTKDDILFIETKLDWISIDLDDEEGVSYNGTLESYDINGMRFWINYSGRFNVNLDFYDGSKGWAWGIKVLGNIGYATDASQSYAVTGSNPENITLKYRMAESEDEYISSEYAKKYYNRQKLSKVQYTFSSLSSYELGAFYSLVDTVAGRTSLVRIISKKKDADGIYSYKAEGAGTVADYPVTIVDESKFYSVIEDTQGEEGKSIGSIKTYYLLSNQTTGITRETEGWQEEPLVMSPSLRYLWQYMHYKYTDGTDAAITDPVIVGTYGQKGDKGETGSSNALITLYKRSATEPSSFDGGALTYTFATDTLSGNLGTWSRSISSGSNPLYAITARAYGTGETDIIDIGEWSTPAILSENGTKGENGSTVAVISLYKRGDSAPATPSKTVSFSFHTYTVTNSDGWTLGIPSGSAPCWSIYATAVSSDGVSDTIEPSEWSTPIKAFENGAKGEKGDTGTAGSYLSFFVSRILVDCYAEGDIIGDEKITFNAQSDGEITLEIDSTPIKTATRLLEYSATPAQVLGDKQSVLVVAKTSKIQQSYTISRVIRKGSLSITADKSSIPFYADNVPHSSADKITLSVSAVNYKNTPKLYLNGVAQTVESKSDYTFDVSQSAFKNTDTIVAKVICGQDVDSIVLSKALDVGSLTLTADKTSFDFYADNVAVNTSEKATITIEQQGYSKMPDLILNSVKTTYSAIGNKGTYSIPVTALQDISSLEVKIANEKEMKALQIIKTKQNPSLTLQVSTPVVDFYYDNVAISGNVTVTVKYSGLFYAPLCKIGTTPVALSSAGVGTIPISSFKDVDSLTVDAYAQKNLVYSVSQTITKTKRPLNLSLGASATQFSYDSKNAVSPSAITLTNFTTGLSNPKLVTLKVGGTAKTWSDTNTFSVTPDMVTGRYLNIELSYGTEKTSMIITKTYDGKAEIIQYSKTKSFKIYPDDEYSFTYNASGLTYNGQTFVWTITWSETIPDISSNEYLWRRSRNSETDAWQYTRLTGIQGDKGEQGGGEYLGHYTTAPTKKPNGDSIANGDYYLNTATVGSPLPYRYKNGQWVLITTSDKDWSLIASATMEDVNNFGGALLSTSSYYAFFQLLSAQKAFVNSLGAQNITLNENGLIQSENYESTEGAEGFRINADGSVDFSTGTWRGSFANGLSFIPATHMIAKKTMTHKQVYQAMKKAGIVSGIYKTADLQAFVDTGAISGENGESAPYTSSGINTGNGFACLDYAQSALTMNIPLFTTFSGILPINPDLYLIFHGTKNGSTVTKNVYLVTKTMLATAQFNTSEIYDFTSLKQYPQSSLVNCITISADDKPKVVFIGAVVNGKLIAHDIEAGTVGLYSFNTTTMSTTKEATLNLISSSWTIERGYAPSYNYHEFTDSSGKYWETSLVSADFKSFAISKTADLKTYSVISTYTTAYTSNPPIPLDVVRVGSRIFGQILEQTTVSNTIHNTLYFAEYNTTTKKWDRIPDSYSTVEDLASINIPSLLVKNGVIYGSKSGYDLFSYNPTTSVFADLSSILKTGLPTTVSCDKKIKELVEVVKPLTFDYVTNYTNNTVKYSKTKHWQNLRVTGISWSTKLNALIISANVHENDGIYAPLFNIVYSYDITTGKTKMISPIFAAIETENTTAEFNPINPYVESSSIYAISAGNSVLVSEIPTANEMSFTVNNIKFTDLFAFYNGEKTLDSVLFPTPASVPLGIKSQFQLWASLEKEVLISKAVEYGDNRLYNTTDTTLTFHCAVPFAHETKMIIREKADAYEIILGTYRLLGYSSGMFPSFFGPNNKAMMSILRFEIFSSADAEPILTVKKNSDEDFNASFIWDFPAQLTVAEDIKTVVKADVFRDNITITNKS